MGTVILLFWCICFTFIMIDLEDERRAMGETVVEYYLKHEGKIKVWSFLGAMLVVLLGAPLLAAIWKNYEQTP